MSATAVHELSREAARLFQSGQAAQAGETLERALAEARRRFAAPHAVIADCLANLGDWHRAGQRWKEAETHLREALAQREALGGPEVGSVLTRLGALLGRTGRLEEAEQFHREALASFARFLEPDDLRQAEALLPLAQILALTGRAPEAEPPLRRALQLLEARLGRAHGRVAQAEAQLARLLDQLGRGREAERSLRRQVEILDAIYRTAGKEPAALFPARRDYYELLARLGYRSRTAQTRLRALTEGRDPGDLPVADPSAGGPDFDALARAAAAPQAPESARAALHATVLGLEHWHFVAVGEPPTQHPHVGVHPGLVNGLPMLKAFTDLDRLRLFANDHSLGDGVLSLPVPRIAPLLEEFLAQGLTHLHFNADDCSDGFYLTLRQAVGRLRAER